MSDTVALRQLPGPSCLPVTALYSFQIRHDTFLLSGSGGSLSIRNVSTREQASTSQIFVAQAIHGIKGRTKQPESVPYLAPVLVWGGQKLSLCEIHVQYDENSQLPSKANVTKLWSQVLDDWILDVTFNDSGTAAVVLTAHNVVYRLQLNGEHVPLPSLLCDELQTLLYSGCLVFDHQDTLLIGSGTVFGEILVWRCSELGTSPRQAQLQHLYVGHRGSIFGVSISEPIPWEDGFRRLLASCSDDRTIRVWNIAEGNEDAIPFAVDGGQHETGFGGATGDTDALAMAWGHLSRIWHVKFLQASKHAGGDYLALATRGEDGVCQYWTLNKYELFSESQKQSAILQSIYQDRHHAGKNIWSWVQSTVLDQHQIFTGGADGQIIARSFKDSAGERADRHLTIPFQSILDPIKASAISTSNQTIQPSKALKQYLILDDGVLVATSDAGALLRSSLNDIQTWSLVASDAHEVVRILCSNHVGRLVFFGTSHGKIGAYDVSMSRILTIDCSLPAQVSWMQLASTTNVKASQSDVFRLVLTFHGNHLPMMLTIRWECETLVAVVHKLRMPPDFQITAFHFDENQNNLIFGSRSGALAVFHGNQSSLQDINVIGCIRHAHGSDSVTSIISLPQAAETAISNAWYLTTGRDGTYAVHMISVSGPELTLSMRTVHRSRPQLGSNVEGAFLQQDGVDKQTLILYGFRSKEFVVWDESHQKQLLAVDCGGAHRSWNFQVTPSTGVGAFVWTKAGAFNTYQKLDRSCEIIQPGGHGREIKALSVSTFNDTRHNHIIATGAEDTDIRLFKYDQDNTHFECVSTLQGHTTGLQHLAFSRDGKYLFSSAGCEEVHAWQIHEIPVLGLGGVLAAKLTKEAEDSDARIMSFDVVDALHESDDTATFQLALAYSNGKVKSFTFSTFSSEFKLVKELFIGMTCLTQAHFLNSTLILVGATDGIVRLVQYPDMVTVVNASIHQNNIAGMITQQLDEFHSFIITGGDDNAVGFSVIQFDAQPRIQTSLVADAHAAASTAVSIMDHFRYDDHHVVLATSAGNDQKVKLWQIRLNLQHPPHSGSRDENTPPICVIEVKKVSEQWTGVADISSMEVMRKRPATADDQSTSSRYEILVAGVGMEVLQLQLDTESRK